MSRVIELNSEIKLLTSVLAECNVVELQAKYEKDIADKKAELIQAAVDAAMNPVTAGPTPSVVDYGSYHLNLSLINTLPIFKGVDPGEVANFSTKVKQISSSTGMSDQDIIRLVKGKLSTNCYRTMEQFETSTGKPIATLEEFYNFLSNNWGQQLSCLQLLEGAFSLRRKSDETWPVFNSRIQTSLSRVKVAHKEFLRSESKELSADQVFELFQSYMVMTNIAAGSQDLYRVLTQGIGSLKNPGLLSQRAAILKTQGHFTQAQVLFSDKKKKSGRGYHGSRNNYKGKSSWSNSKDKPVHSKDAANKSNDKTKGKSSSQGDKPGSNFSWANKAPLSLMASSHWSYPDESKN